MARLLLLAASAPRGGRLAANQLPRWPSLGAPGRSACCGAIDHEQEHFCIDRSRQLRLSSFGGGVRAAYQIVRAMLRKAELPVSAQVAILDDDPPESVPFA